jgi:hypothetical protein
MYEINADVGNFPKVYNTWINFGKVSLKKAYFCTKNSIMIQRIQTLFLIVSALLIGILFILPFAELAKDGVIYLFNCKGIMLDGVVKQSGFVVVAFIAIILAVSVFIIADFKNRKRQINTILLNIVLKLALLGILVFYSYFSFIGAQVSLKVGMVFPLLAIVFDYLAISGVRKDEALIRSIDRIR